MVDTWIRAEQEHKHSISGVSSFSLWLAKFGIPCEWCLGLQPYFGERKEIMEHTIVFVVHRVGWSSGL